MSQNIRGGKRNRQTDDLMDQSSSSPKRSLLGPLSTDVVRIDILSLNGKPFTHKFTSKDIKHLWSTALRRDESEIVGQSCAWLNKNTLRINIELAEEVVLKDVSDTPDFLYEKSTEFQNYSYECKMVGFGGFSEAVVGDVVTVNLRRGHFRFKPENAEDWLVVYGRLIGSARSVIFLCVCVCVCNIILDIIWLSAGVGRNNSCQLLRVDDFTRTQNHCQINRRLGGVFVGQIAVSLVLVLMHACVIGKILPDLYPCFSDFPPRFQQHHRQRGPQNGSNNCETGTKGTSTRVATDVWLQDSSLLSWHPNPVQPVLGFGPYRQGVQERADQLERLCQKVVQNWPLQEGNVRVLAEGDREARDEPRRGIERTQVPLRQVNRFEKARDVPEDEGLRGDVISSKKGKTKVLYKEENAKGLIWWNCRGGIRSKIDIIKNYIHSFKPDLFFISESNIKDDDDLLVINVENYTLYRSASINGCSRLACYAKNDSGFELSFIARDEVQIIGMENKKIRAYGIYRPFTNHNGLSQGANFDCLLKCLNEIPIGDKTTYVGGDFNADYLRMNDPSYHLATYLNRLEIWSIENGLTQHISEVTRLRSITMADGSRRIEESCLDHLYGEVQDDRKRTYKTVNIPGSDHVAVMVSWEEMPIRTKKTVTRDWRNYNMMKLTEVMKEDASLEHMETLRLATDADDLNSRLAAFHRYVLNRICPERVVRLRRQGQVVDNQIEKLKKRRDRQLKLYHKHKDVFYLDFADSLSKQLRKTISRVAKRRLQLKATSPDPKTFWKAVKEISGKDAKNPELKIKDSQGNVKTDPQELAETFADFFIDKAATLSSRTKPEEEVDQHPDQHSSMMLISMDMIEKAVRKLKPKKSYGIDGVPLCIVKDVFQFIPHIYHKLLSMAARKIPDQWKIARVLPLYKKGSRYVLDNYRPISNLCSIDKLFEKIVLDEINRRHPGIEGEHQHGFRQYHSTTTAMLEIQNEIVSHMEEGQGCSMYSIDLSAAFDLLRKNTFVHQAKDTIDPDLLSVLADFLSERKMVVEIDGKVSSSKHVPLGCVQGSVLGPKLFNIYMSRVAEHTLGNKLVAYADDSYVIIPGKEKAAIENCVKTHLDFLSSQGMVTNISKTEAVFFGLEQYMETLHINGEELKFSGRMKVLGVTFDARMKFSEHIESVIKKARTMNSGLRMIRRKLTYDQFLKVMTTQYYGRCFYGGLAWLNGTNSFLDLRKINALHYRALRIAKRDFKRVIRRSELDLMGRARPTTWIQYLLANTAIKAITRGQPTLLSREMRENMFIERRRSGRPKFFDNSKKKIGRQALRNRLGFMGRFKFDWSSGLTDDNLRVNLKKELGINTSDDRLH